MNVTLDKAGRVVIPKRLRQQLHLAPGGTLELESEGHSVTLRPVRPQALLKKEHGVWVYQGESADISIPDRVDGGREKRVRETLG